MLSYKEYNCSVSFTRIKLFLPMYSFLFQQKNIIKTVYHQTTLKFVELCSINNMQNIHYLVVYLVTYMCTLCPQLPMRRSPVNLRRIVNKQVRGTIELFCYPNCMLQMARNQINHVEYLHHGTFSPYITSS